MVPFEMTPGYTNAVDIPTEGDVDAHGNGNSDNVSVKFELDPSVIKRFGA